MSDYRHSEFFVLRTPLLPFDDFLAWTDGLDINAETHGSAETSGRQQQALAAERLGQLVRRPEVLEAIRLATPEFAAKCELDLADSTASLDDRALRTLGKYISRMSGRPTPFGSFATIAVGEIGQQTNLRVGSSDQCLRTTRLDNGCLSKVVDRVVDDLDVRSRLHFRVNGSAYVIGGEVRYAEARSVDDLRVYALTRVPMSPEVGILLERATPGATLGELIAAITKEGHSADEASTFVEEAVAAQMLVPEIEVPVTGDDALRTVLSQLRQRAPDAQVTRRVATLASAIDSFNQGKPPSLADRDHLSECVDGLVTDVNHGRLLQVDTLRTGQAAVLGEDLVSTLWQGVDVLHRLRMCPVDDPLEGFRQRFTERYGDACVPLSEALDADVGIGFENADDRGAELSPILQGLPFPLRRGASQVGASRDSHLLRLLTTHLSRGSDEIRLEENDIAAMERADREPLPDAVHIAAMVADQDGAGETDVYLMHVAGPSGARTIGRFGHCDASLLKNITRHLRDEEALKPDCVFAEAVHLPAGHLANVTFRPVLRSFEIPYLGGSGAPIVSQLPLNDLSVRIDGNLLILSSAKLGKQVVPRITNAHNVPAGRSLPVYKFLYALQQQGRAQHHSWSWGSLSAAARLPRVRYRNVLLALGSWRLYGEQLASLRELSPAARRESLKALRSELRLPTLVGLLDGELLLPLDLRNPVCVDILLHEAQHRDHVVLQEWWPSPDMMPARNEDGHFVHEIVVPMVRKSPLRNNGVARAAVPMADARRTYDPGSEWMYLKLYGGTASADRLLVDHVAPLVRHGREARDVASWFFIRYRDPEPHLRVRLRLRHGRTRGLDGALNAMLAAARAERLIWRVQMQTYDREVERYGGFEGIEASEAMFDADSDSVVTMLAVPAWRDPAFRWQFAACGIFAITEACLLPEAETIAMLAGMREGLTREFRVDTPLFKRRLSERHRELRTTLDKIFPVGTDVTAHPFAELLSRRKRQLHISAGPFRALAESGRLQRSRQEVVSDVVHMFMNRVLRSEHRMHELVLYDIVHRRLLAAKARERDRQRDIEALVPQ